MTLRPVENLSSSLRVSPDSRNCSFPDEFYLPAALNSLKIDADPAGESVRPLSVLDTMNPCQMTDQEREVLQRHKRRQDAFKTALCDTFRRTGHCSYSDGCRFAHTQDELRAPTQPRGRLHPKYKTVLCENFEREGECRYGSRCMYIHRRSQARNISFVEQQPVDEYTLGQAFKLRTDAMALRSFVPGHSRRFHFDEGNTSLPVTPGQYQDLFNSCLPQTSRNNIRRLAPSPTNPVDLEDPRPRMDIRGRVEGGRGMKMDSLLSVLPESSFIRPRYSSDA